MNHPDPAPPSRAVVPEVQALLSRLAAAPPLEKPGLQHAFFQRAGELLGDAEGLAALAAAAPGFDEAGVFRGGPWEDPTQLQVPLVAGTLRAPDPVTPVVESLSELRLLALATERARSEVLSAEEARTFLDEVMARNLRYLLPGSGATEEEREGGDPHRESHERLFALLVDELGLGRILEEVVLELEQVLAQRPLSTWRVRRTILRARRLARDAALSGTAAERLEELAVAIDGPSPLAREAPDLGTYRETLRGAAPAVLRQEAEAFAASMRDTGLVSRAHAVFVRAVLDEDTELLITALDLGDVGRAELEQDPGFLRELVEAAAHPTTCQCLYGLGQALERSLFSRPEVRAGLERLLDLDLQEQVQEVLLAHRSEDDPVTAEAVLLAGTLALLGQPLGVGQGRNPTCQAARGMSLWAQHDPARLLEWIVAAARDGRLEVTFHGQQIRSDQLPRGIAGDLDLDLDPVSLVLVPHLDRLYSEFMRRCIFGLEDAHKQVNPALYGRWVPRELASAFADLAQTTVVDFGAFVRCFFASHHPDYNGGNRLMYPNPVGLVITNHAGRYLGPHAVSVQRVDQDPEGEVRVYFFNPNNEGRQDWGRGVCPTVRGHGEEPGESSLPFAAFASRVYAFHYNPDEEGDRAAVPDHLVAEVTREARATWGARFVWLGVPAAPPSVGALA